jgi:hypothetical protein
LIVPSDSLPRPRDHEYATSAIMRCVMIYLRGCVSFRACSAAIDVLQQDLPQFDRAPAPNTIQSWILRIGLYELLRPKEVADDWVALLDHTCQLGNLKCLVILGIRLSNWRQLKRPLEFHDMTVLMIEIVATSDGEIVKKQLGQLSSKIGTLAAIVSDQGSDLVKGTKLMVDEQRVKNPERSPTRIFQDFSHASSHIFKERLLADSRWNEFLGECGRTQPKVKQTPLGALAPPTQKVKGRYMNVGELICWGKKMLNQLDCRYGKLPAGISREQLQLKFGWLTGYRNSLNRWHELHRIREEALVYMRSAGYHATAATELASKLYLLRNSEASRTMVDQLTALVQEQSEGLDYGESYPASTEILESLIGKGKQMQFQHSRGGFTKMVAAMAASVVNLSEQVVTESLEAVRESNLRSWARGLLGVTMDNVRRMVLGGTNVT